MWWTPVALQRQLARQFQVVFSPKLRVGFAAHA
jgi:hypothetical protein